MGGLHLLGTNFGLVAGGSAIGQRLGDRVMGGTDLLAAGAASHHHRGAKHSGQVIR